MNDVCRMIKKQTITNFINMETAIKTYDRNALVCGTPAWRYVYHAIHSADKWFFNPAKFIEPDFHENGMDNPDNQCNKVFPTKNCLNICIRYRLKQKAILII